jgi:eukaryotic-like serine/threonine-protein kinase
MQAYVGVSPSNRSHLSAIEYSHDLPCGIVGVTGFMTDSAARSSNDTTSPHAVRTVGRYILSRSIARGGMAAVHLAKLHGDEGFSRVVAAKRLHEQFAEDDAFVRMFLEEARIASKIHHPNVVPVLDVLRSGGEVILIQDYVHGVPLDRLLSRARDAGKAIPLDIALGVMVPSLHGLHAAHESSDEFGVALEVVHRDVSPQNILMSVEGIPRIIDFGIAKASSSGNETQAGLFKGKVAYMSSEQLRGEKTDRRTDIYAAGMTLWEILAARRAYPGLSEAKIFSSVLTGKVPSLEEATQTLSLSSSDRARMTALIAIVNKALALDPSDRYQTAADFADALLGVLPPASAKTLSAWVKSVGADYLAKRDVLVAQAFSATSVDEPESVRSVVSGVKPSERWETAEGSASGLAKVPAPQSESQVSESQVSVVDSVVAGTKRWGLAAALLVSLLTIAGLVGYLLRSSSDTATREQTPSQDSLKLPPAPTRAPPTTAEPATTLAAQASLTATPTASAPVVNHPVAARGGAGGGYVKPTGPALKPVAPIASSASHTPPADCSPPFYYEGTRKVFKPQCVQ